MKRNKHRHTDETIDMSDLMELKKSVDGMTDADIYDLIARPGDPIEFSQCDVNRLQDRINDEINSERKARRVRRVVTICVAIVLPLVVVAALAGYLWQSPAEAPDCFYAGEICIKTDNGESSVTLLPDGSEIKLGPKSKLSYSMSSFNNNMRHINYTGEGFFEIARHEDIPFTINVNKFEIEVLGTTFAVKSRDYKEYSEIYLREGSIQLMSYLTKRQYQMEPGQLAIINNETGGIDIMPSSDEYMLCTQPVLIFKSATMRDITTELLTYYGIDLQLSDGEIASQRFTGSIPTDDLDQALYILGTAMQVRIEKVSPGHYIQK